MTKKENEQLLNDEMDRLAKLISKVLSLAVENICIIKLNGADIKLESTEKFALGVRETISNFCMLVADEVEIQLH